LRFWYLDTGLPSLAERSSGFLFERLDPSELQLRFVDRRVVFYSYNVITSLLSVLLSEPHDGLFVATRTWRGGDVHPYTYLTVLSSLALTVVMAWTAFRWWRAGPPFGGGRG